MGPDISILRHMFIFQHVRKKTAAHFHFSVVSNLFFSPISLSLSPTRYSSPPQRPSENSDLHVRRGGDEPSALDVSFYRLAQPRLLLLFRLSRSHQLFIEDQRYSLTFTSSQPHLLPFSLSVSIICVSLLFFCNFRLVIH